MSVAPRKFFGHERYKVYDRSFSISTPVKTLIDCLDRPDLAGGPAELARIVHSALANVSPEDALAAAMKIKLKAVLQRLGFLSDLVGRPLPDDVRQKLRDAIPKKYRSHFGRPRGRPRYRICRGLGPSCERAARGPALGSAAHQAAGRCTNADAKPTAPGCGSFWRAGLPQGRDRRSPDPPASAVLREGHQNVAFKGGTMLRKMIFGPRGRLSTDLISRGAVISNATT